MAAGAEIYADRETLARIGDQSLVGDVVRDTMADLVDAQQDFGRAVVLHENDVAAIDAQVTLLEKQRNTMLAERHVAISKGGHHQRDSGFRLVQALEDPESPINDVYRAALLAPTLRGMQWDPRTFAIADTLGKALVTLDDHLQAQSQSVPVAAIKYRTDETGDGYRYARINFGRTVLSEGMIPHMLTTGTERLCFCGAHHEPEQPLLEVSVAASTRGVAITSTEDTFVVSLARPDEERVADAPVSQYGIWGPDTMPLQHPTIPLATGQYADTDLVMARYDAGDAVNEVMGPTPMDQRARSYCAIGEQAVNQALLDTYRRTVRAGHSDGMVMDMTQFVAGRLGMPMQREAFAAAN